MLIEVEKELKDSLCEILKTDKQFIIVRGNRMTGKSYAGLSLVMSVLFSDEQKQAYIILPSLRHVFNVIRDVEIYLHDENYIYRIDKNQHRIELKNGSEIQFFTPTDIFSYGFRGYRRPDIVFIDDLEMFEKRTSKKIFRLIKEDYCIRGWNCKFYITFFPTVYNRMVMGCRGKERFDRCDALFRLAGSNSNWYRTEWLKPVTVQRCKRPL